MVNSFVIFFAAFIGYDNIRIAELCNSRRRIVEVSLTVNTFPIAVNPRRNIGRGKPAIDRFQYAERNYGRKSRILSFNRVNRDAQIVSVCFKRIELAFNGLQQYVAVAVKRELFKSSNRISTVSVGVYCVFNGVVVADLGFACGNNLSVLELGISPVEHVGRMRPGIFNC